MCDCPITTIYTTHEKVKCSWIVYGSNITNSNENMTQSSIHRPEDEHDGADEACSNTNESDPALDNVYMMLEPHLRPVTPDLDLPQSKQIFDEHKQLAQEYFKVQTELAYLSQHRKELLQQRGSEQLSQSNQLNKLQDERDQLRKLHQNLLRQLELLKTSNINENRDTTVTEDGWELISQNDN